MKFNFDFFKILIHNKMPLQKNEPNQPTKARMNAKIFIHIVLFNNSSTIGNYRGKSICLGTTPH